MTRTFPNGAPLMSVCAGPHRAAGTRWGSRKHTGKKRLEAALKETSIVGWPYSDEKLRAICTYYLTNA